MLPRSALRGRRGRLPPPVPAPRPVRRRRHPADRPHRPPGCPRRPTDRTPGQAVPPPVGEEAFYPIGALSEDPDTEVRDNGREVQVSFNAAVNVKLADGDRKIHPGRYVVQEDNTARAALCLCSSTSGVWSTANNFAPNETKHFWTLLQLPSTPTTTAEIADLPAVSVSVSQ